MTFIIATMGINIVANFVSPAYDIANLFPKHIDFKKGGLIASILAVLVCPWIFVDSPKAITVFVSIFGAVLAPLFGVMVADYYLVKKQIVKTAELYTMSPNGQLLLRRRLEQGRPRVAGDLRAHRDRLGAVHPAVQGPAGEQLRLGHRRRRRRGDLLRDDEERAPKLKRDGSVREPSAVDRRQCDGGQTQETEMRFFKSLFGQVVLAAIVGVVLGITAPEFAAKLKPLGDGFIKLIKMLIAPIVFCVVVHGIAGAGDLKKVGRVGVKAVIYFEVMTTIALALGIVLAYVFQPGVGMNIDPKALDPSAMSSYVDTASKVKSSGTTDFLLKLIPTTFVGAFANGDVLQVLVIAIMAGCALALLGEPGKPLLHLIEQASHMLFKMMFFIVKLAPLGVLGAIAFTVGQYGVGSLKQLGYLVALFYVTVALFVVVVLGGVLRMAGFSLFKFLAYLKDELMIVLGTASSDSVLPQVMRKLERMGIKDSTVGLVIPTGYSFNLDAFSIYLTLAAVFIAQATNTPLSLGDLLVILGVSLVTSKGAHGVPGSAIVILAATLSAVPAVPLIGLVLVLSVDWFVGMARALGNLIGNCVATVVVAAWEGDIDKQQARRVLDGDVEVTLDETAKDFEADTTTVPARP